MPWLARYMKHGGDLDEEILNIFGQMQEKGVSPDAITYTCMLIACGRIGAKVRASQYMLILKEKEDNSVCPRNFTFVAATNACAQPQMHVFKLADCETRA